MDWAVLLLLAAAAGLNLPLLLLLPFLLGLVPWLPTPEGGWSLLASFGPAALGALLLAVSVLLRRVPGLGELWTGTLAVATIPTSLLLAVLLLAPDRGVAGVVGGAGVAVLLSGTLQGTRLGLGLLRALDAAWPGQAPGRWEPAVAGALAVLLVLAASTGSGLAALAVLPLLAVGIWILRSALAAVRFLPGLILGVLRHLSGEGGWRVGRQLPSWLPRDRDVEPGLRGVPAGLTGSSREDGFRAGWLLVGEQGPRFLYRTLFQVWEVDLGDATPGDAESLPWGYRLPLRLDDAPRVLVLPRDGPDPAVQFGRGRRARTTGNPVPEAGPPGL